MRALALVALLACHLASAHPASDAFLTLEHKSAATIEARWEIALRDLHFVREIDDDGDGAITWAEVKRHQRVIAAYAYERLQASAAGLPCAIEPGRQLVSRRVDGAYAALFFRIVCKGAPRKVTLDYRAFFDVDPTHRGIVVFRSGGNTATLLLSPEVARIELPL
jgi:hypothetical protein